MTVDATAVGAGSPFMLKASTDSVPWRLFVMTEPKFPAICGRDCGHLTCSRIYMHWQRRTCVECHQLIEAGEQYEARGKEIRHHGTCPERTC